MNVLFINPPSVPYTLLQKSFQGQWPGLTQTVAMPMGILYLVAVLERDLPEVNIEVMDLALAYRHWADEPVRSPITLDRFIDTGLDQIPWRPDIVGLSILFSTAHKTTLRIAELAKARWPTARVIVGGMHATNAVAALLGNPAVDYVCRGEAETIIADFVRGGRPQGVIGRENPALNESCPLIQDLDEIPFPAWHRLRMDQYLYAVSRARRTEATLDAISQDGVATIVTTRGCPFRCTFCASWTVHGREMRYRSIPNVLQELELLATQYQVRDVVPEDDLFTVKKARIIALCEAVHAKFGGMFHFQFPNGLSVATLDADVIRALKLMGMTVCNIAIESGNADVQKRIIKKNVDLERARRVVEACRAEGITVRAYFILGFPGETRAQMQDSIDFAASLPLDWTTIHPAAPLVGTEMYEQMLEWGQIDAAFNWDSAFFAERAFDTPEIKAQELKDLCYRANLELNFFRNYNCRIGNYPKAIRLFKDILRAYPGHLAAQYALAEIAERQNGSENPALEWARTMHLMSSDPMAQEMQARFPDLFPRLHEAECRGNSGVPAALPASQHDA